MKSISKGFIPTSKIFGVSLRSKRGFTLIEMLVVVAIISILATVVLGQLTRARAQAANAAVKSTLSNLRTQATLVYSAISPNSYENVCTDPVFVQGLTHAGTVGGVPAECFDALETWVVKATLQLPENTYTHWCTDSTAKSQGVTEAQYNAITSASTLCP